MLQETHSVVQDEKLWSMEWGGDIWFAHGSTQSRGVAVLVKKNIPVSVENIKADLDGRLLIMDVKIGEIKLILSNFYGPNEDDDSFFVQAFEKIEERDNPNMIMGGDFNTALNPKLDSNCNTDNHKKKREVIRNYLELREMVDIWRTHNPEKYQYTWKRDRLALNSSRIDYFFISESLCTRVLKTDIVPGYKSDHWRLEIQLNMESQPRGKGFWKLNTSYLYDKQFLEELNEKIDTYLWEVKADITPSQNWELLKLEVTSFCTEFSCRKAKAKNRLIDKLEHRLKILDEKLAVSSDHNEKLQIADKIRQTENFLINEHEEITEKKREFYRLKWHNLGERNNKYFFNMAKARYNAKVITKLKTPEGLTVEEPKEILRTQFQFYKKLFTEENLERPFPYTNDTGPKLSSEEKEELDQPLDISELAKAIQSMENGKTPGCDGLQAEFYKMFWSKLKYVLFDALTYALQKGQLHKSATRGHK